MFGSGEDVETGTVAVEAEASTGAASEDGQRDGSGLAVDRRDSDAGGGG